MTAFLDRLRERFPQARTRGGELVLAEHRVTGAAPVSWLADADGMRLVFALPRAGSAAAYTPARQEALVRALAGLLQAHLGLALRPDRTDEALVLAGGTTQDPDMFSRALAHLVALVNDVAQHGLDPFAALGRRDEALERREEPPLPAADDSVPSESASRFGSAEGLPASGSVLSNNHASSFGAVERSTATFACVVRLADDGRRLELALGLGAVLPVGFDRGRLAALLRGNLEHRFDVLLAAAPPAAETLLPGAVVVTLAGHVLAGVDGASVRSAMAAFLERVTAFLGAGLPLDEVLNPELERAAEPPLPLSPPSPPRPAEPPPPARPVAPPPPLGPRVDIHLRAPGIDRSRIEQILGLLLSVDVLQARELCQAAPCLLLPDVERERADEIVALIARAGGRAVLSPAGHPPSD